MKPSDFDVDVRFISHEEVDQYLIGLTGRERRNHRRIQAWIDHCERIRSHPSSTIPLPGEISLPELAPGSGTAHENPRGLHSLTLQPGQPG